MPRYIALLRGINVGGNKKVPMAQLRAVLEGQACKDVATLLQSGNAVFTSAERDATKLGRRIEAAFEKEFGFDSAFILRTRDELAAAIRKNPFDAVEDPSRFVVMFLSDTPDPKRVRAIDAKAYAPDEFRVVGREIYAWFPNGMARSKLFTALGEARLGVTPTARNWNTVGKLLELADQSS